MVEIKTRATDADVTTFLDLIQDDGRREDARTLRAIMERVTGVSPRMWGPTMVGFGSKPYTNTTGTREWFVVGFSPRKTALTLYGLYNDYESADPLFEDLGPHTTGKGCLYLKRLNETDLSVLEKIIRERWQASLKD